MADYRIESDGTVVEFRVSVRLRERQDQPIRRSAHGLRSKPRWDTAQFVRAGEAEGFTFEGKEFLAQAS